MVGRKLHVSAILIILLVLSLNPGAVGVQSEDLISSATETPVYFQDSFDNPEPTIGADPAVTWAQFTSPSTNLTYNTLKLADVNIDGQLDVITGYDGQGIVMWLANASSGWQLAASPTNIGNYKDLSIGDINNDGKPDIVGARTGGISAWFGDGSGTVWSADVGPAATATFNSLVLDDMNNDGDLDIIAAATGSGTRKGVQVFRGYGDGTWAAADTNMPLSTRYNGICAGDFNNDGKTDIVAAGDTIGVDAWTGNGGGTWTISHSGLAISGIYSDVKLSDFDNDGNLDIVATGGNNNGIMVCKGDGTGYWTPKVNLPLNGTYTSVETCDLNLDGYMDIITTSTTTNQAVWTGDGAFNWYLQTGGLPTGVSYSDLSSGDINRDGHQDICMAKTISGIDIYTSQALREVNSWSMFPSPTLADAVNDIEIFDVNLDGKMDICYATNTSGLRIWKGNGAGTWTSFASPITTGIAHSVSSCDFNNDGKPDIVAAISTGIRAWTGNGAGTWTQTIVANGVWYGLAVADFNDDGKLDIAGGSGTNGGLFVWNGNGAGTWAITVNLPMTGTYYDIDVADVNRNGALDLVAANGGLKVFLGNAANGWSDSSAGLPASTNLYKSVKAADLNNDKKIDIVGASDTAGVNTWMGNGIGLWSFNSTIVAAHGRGLSVKDFSIDGNADAVTGSSQNSGIQAGKHLGNGWTQVSTGLPTSGNYISVKMADVNIDGRLDIITYNNSGLNSQIWVGDYVAPPIPSFSIGPLAVGWNFVSYPLVQTDATMPNALTDLDNDTFWSFIKYYDSTDSYDPWKSYCIYNPDNMRDLIEVNEKMGIWLNIPNSTALGDGFIRIEGTASISTQISLNTGWNLVGYPSSVSRMASSTLPGFADMVSDYRTTAPFVLDHAMLAEVTMSPGNAYWVHVTSDCTWTVDY